MTLQRKVRKAGHSVVVTLPSQLAELAGLNEGNNLPDALFLTMCHPPSPLNRRIGPLSYRAFGPMCMPHDSPRGGRGSTR